MPAPQSLPSRLIGALFVERGLVSESQIRVALEIQRETGQQLGQVLVERFGVSRKELASVVAEQWAKLGGSAGPEDVASWRRLGDIFVERGFVTQDELDQALTRQRQTGERLGEALVAQGVISKFELAGALAEQMAALGEPDAETEVANGQPEATVHQLRARDDVEPTSPATNVIDLAPPAEWGAERVEQGTPPIEADAGPVAEEPIADEPVEQTDALDAVVASAEPAEASRPAEVMLTELHDALTGDASAVGDERLETLEAVSEETEASSPVTAPPTEPDAAPPTEEPIAAELPAAGDDHEMAEAYAETVEEPWTADVMPIEVHHIPAPEIGHLDDAAPAVDQRTPCVAFAPTLEGYRLVALEAQPEPGETIDIPEVGEYLVLRVGSSPIPGDDRRCAYVEERVTAALVGAVAH
jgi:hypothetical protein